MPRRSRSRSLARCASGRPPSCETPGRSSGQPPPIHESLALGPDEDQPTSVTGPRIVLRDFLEAAPIGVRGDRSDVERVDVVDRLIRGAVDDDVRPARAKRPTAGADDDGVGAVADDAEPGDPPHDVARRRDTYLLQVFGAEEDGARRLPVQSPV